MKKLLCVGIGVAVAASAVGCKTETQLMACGAVGVAGVGGVASWATSESTAYDPDLRDDDGRLVPIAQQNDKNLVPVAVAMAGATVLVSGLLLAAAVSETYDDAQREAKREEALATPPPEPAPEPSPEPSPESSPEPSPEPVGDVPPPM